MNSKMSDLAFLPPPGCSFYSCYIFLVLEANFNAKKEYRLYSTIAYHAKLFVFYWFHIPTCLDPPILCASLAYIHQSTLHISINVVVVHAVRSL
ncbi:hypothetical protein F5X96DRAFT_613736 [Biscogniauxia mediterranea]|nr:hypothetical protein F5X96DRAFT_613736 [Biscogniauxia mediterranea]